jgi:dTDP-4-dehydrorhamnose reductase
LDILITGAGGQLGQALLRQAAPGTCTGLTHAELDIADAGAVAQAMRAHVPRLLINAAAWTDVDAAEREAAATFATNRDGAANLAAACAAAGIPLFHLSTDHVFDGRGLRPWREDDAVSPLGVYGASKAAGEAAIRRHLEAHIILRTSWVFGATGRNFVKTLLRLARTQERVRVVDSHVGGPTPASALASALLQLASRHLAGESLPWGSHHFAGRPFVSRLAFAEAVFDGAVARGLLPRRPVLEAAAAPGWPGAVLRPANARLDTTQTEQALGLTMPDWRLGLAEVLDELARNPQRLA